VEILFLIKKEKMQSKFIVLLLALLACVLAQAADKNRVKSKHVQAKADRVQAQAPKAKVNPRIVQAHVPIVKGVKGHRDVVQQHKYRGVSSYTHVKSVKAVKAYKKSKNVAQQKKYRGVSSYSHVRAKSDASLYHATY
jgi:hypothetical protein